MTNGKTQKLPSRPSLVEQHLQDKQPKRTVLVLDSGAIIKGVRVERLGTEFWTIAEVIDEIRDQRARDYLQTFPYEIKTTEPDPRDMKAGT
jgi:rRNA maturation endonuclease Nob1